MPGSTLGAMQAHRPVQMGSRGSARGPDEAEQPAARQRLALGDADFVEMAVHGDQAPAVVQQYRIAVEEEVAGDQHAARRRRVDRRAAVRGDVEPRVWAARFAVQHAPPPERTGDDAVHGPHEGVRVSRVRTDHRVGVAHQGSLAREPLEVLVVGVDVSRIRDGQALHGVFPEYHDERRSIGRCVAPVHDEVVFARLGVEGHADDGMATVE